MKNFKYLDYLIHSGKKEIVLDSDIVFEDGEESEYFDGIKIDVDDLTIDGKGHVIDARMKGRIFDIVRKGITIKNIAFRNGFNINGGAIFNERSADSCLLYCRIENNMAQDNGGAIKNLGTLRIIKSTLNENRSPKSGGAIYNDSKLKISSSTFMDNETKEKGGGIYNHYRGKLTIADSDFKKNMASCDGGAIYNQYSAKLTITGSSFHENIAKENGGGIVNKNDLFLRDSRFQENIAKGNGKDIFNDGGRITFPMGRKTDINIYDLGVIYELKELDEEQRDFSYLNGLIQSDANEIKLDHDIRLDISKNEEETYSDGIRIDRDDFILDGNDHEIDAQGLARIFYTCGKNIRIKNITLKNGYKPDGGAICNIGKISLENIILKNNYGGAIYNKIEYPDYDTTIEGEVSIENAIIEKNLAESGAIHNEGRVFIKNSRMERNIGQNGGAIYNSRNMDVEDCIISENTIAGGIRTSGGGGILNSGKVTIRNTSFIENSSRKGSAILNSGIDVPKLYHSTKITILNCTFKNNSSETGEIYNERGEIELRHSTFANDSYKRKEIGLRHSTFANDTDKKGYGIYNDSNLKIFNCNFNACKQNLIFNSNLMEIHSSHFEDISSETAIIENDGEFANLSIDKGKFINNASGYAAIYNQGKDCSISGTLFENNHSQKENCHNILNETILLLKDVDLKDEFLSILNNGELSTEKKYAKFIENNGKLNFLDSDNEFNFDYLDKLIQRSNHIVLDENITLAHNEIDFYEGGIELDMDDLVIDGAGHSIDGIGKSRIFIITGKNIVLKNIIFKNGHSFENYFMWNNEGGGIRVYPDADLKIENCRFIGNVSETSGGAIANHGDLLIDEALFKLNKSNDGGSIINFRKIHLDKSCFISNEALRGGAIANHGELAILNTEFRENVVRDGLFKARFRPMLLIDEPPEGGAIYNRAKLTIEKSSFINNEIKSIEDIWGFAIRDNSEEGITVIQTKFTGENLSEGPARAISCNTPPKLIECKLIKNEEDNERFRIVRV